MSRIPKVEFKVNLEDLFGERLDLNEATKQAIGQAIIDRIVERTQDNKDKNGRSLGTYSKSYKDSTDFKILKGAEKLVNLTATGDMLAALTITKTTPQTITIGYDDPAENAKAYGHISGMEGHPVLEGKVPKRDFMGLPDKDLQDIASDFESDVRAIDAIESATTREELNRSILDVIDEFNAQIIPTTTPRGPYGRGST